VEFETKRFTVIAGIVYITRIMKQEAQLMLTNPRDAFKGQSRSPKIVQFHMLGIFPLVQQ